MEWLMRNLLCLLLKGERLPCEPRYRSLTHWIGILCNQRAGRIRAAPGEAAGTKGKQAAFHNRDCLMWRGRAKLWDPDSVGILNQIGQNYARSYFVARQVSQLAVREVAVNTSCVNTSSLILKRQKILHKNFCSCIFSCLLCILW